MFTSHHAYARASRESAHAPTCAASAAPAERARRTVRRRGSPTAAITARSRALALLAGIRRAAHRRAAGSRRHRGQPASRSRAASSTPRHAGPRGSSTRPPAFVLNRPVDRRRADVPRGNTSARLSIYRRSRAARSRRRSGRKPCPSPSPARGASCRACATADRAARWRAGRAPPPNLRAADRGRPALGARRARARSGGRPSSSASPSPAAGRPRCRPRSRPPSKASPARRSSERINATDSEDALKYLPSLNVRKRYIGDYDHAVLATRASGTGNSARSLVYADGILLSNLLGNGATLHAALGPGHARGDRARRRAVRAVLGGLSGQLGRRRGRLRDPHADAARGARQAAGFTQPASSCTAPTTATTAGRPAPRSATGAAPGRGGSTLKRLDSDGAAARLRQPRLVAADAERRRHRR